MNNKGLFFLSLFLGIYILSGFNCVSHSKRPISWEPVFKERPTPWADSVFHTLTLDQKIGQLFMIPAYSNGDGQHISEVEKLIKDYHIGGLIFMQGGPERQAKLTNQFQYLASTPLMLAMDAEWGLGMRLDSTISFPREMALGASDDPELIYDFGQEMARQLKRIGVHISFSPVVDVNNNSNNPVINNRAFGENKHLVTELGIAYMKGLQENGVLACAKHFPGHGDTDVDSHKALPTITHSKERLDSIELFPFKELISKGLGSAMIAHLYIPALDSSSKLNPSTLSRPIVSDLLQKELGFNGLIFTDAMNMQGIAKYFEPGEMDVKALQAGNDVLLFPGDVPKAFNKIHEALKDSTLLVEDIEAKCLKILRAKEWLGIHLQDSVIVENIVNDLNDDQAKSVEQRLIGESLTILENKDDLLPIGRTDTLKIATLTVNTGINNAFNDELEKYCSFDPYKISSSPDFSTTKTITSKLSKYDLVFINILNTSNRPSKNYGVKSATMHLAGAIAMNTKVILNIFANPYSLGKVKTSDHIQGLVIAHHDNEMTQKSVVQLELGAATTEARLPITASGKYGFGHGLAINSKTRLRPVSPEHLDMDASILYKIDSIALEGIKEQAYPGCRIIAIKDGNVFWNKSYGHHTYEEKIKVSDNSVYDLASITKIVASTASLMKLQDEGLINVDYNLCDYVDVCDTSDYYNMNFREMLSHFARLQAWIPFYLNTVEDGTLDADLYRSSPQDGYTTEVAEDLYILDSYRDSIYDKILDTHLRRKTEYKYSDLGYYFVKQAIEDKTGKKLEEFVKEEFYNPLGLQYTGYHPLTFLSPEIITPTEYDMLFRKQLVHGYVHDPGAAMIGGVGGHAGVFSSAMDLAVMMQMFLNGGEYGGQRYIEEETLDYFTTCHYCDGENRRGIGFDKPAIHLDRGSSCNSASSASFGHSGFTGTLAWADPEHEIVYVFLSNRVYPNAENRKLLKMDIRTNIQQVIYDAFNIPAREEIE